MKKIRQEIGDTELVKGFFTDSSVKEYLKADNEFSQGPIRHGQSRRAKAKEKVSERQRNRAKANREVRKHIGDEE